MSLTNHHSPFKFTKIKTTCFLSPGRFTRNVLPEKWKQESLNEWKWIHEQHDTLYNVARILLTPPVTPCLYFYRFSGVWGKTDVGSIISNGLWPGEETIRDNPDDWTRAQVNISSFLFKNYVNVARSGRVTFQKTSLRSSFIGTFFHTFSPLLFNWTEMTRFIHLGTLFFYFSVGFYRPSLCYFAWFKTLKRMSIIRLFRIRPDSRKA